jgi:cell wall-associated NlpC family hydrolase
VSFYASADRQRLLAQVARSWLGTPFHPHAAIRGVGVDCVHLLAEIYRETGLFAGYELPRYTMDGGDHADSSQVLSWLEAHPRFRRLDLATEALAAGDLVTFRLGRVAHHVGLMLSEQTFLHAIRDCGVLESRIDEKTYARRFLLAYRPIS